MAIRPYFGGGTGGGFALGHLDNLFGATSGDATASPSIVLPAANKAAAIAVRDAYSSANPSWLAEYDADSNLNIRLIYLDGGNTIVVHQIRQGGSWVDNGSVTAVEGLPGSGTDFSHVSDNHIPAIGVGPDKLPYDSGIDHDPVTGNLRTPASLTVGSNSLSFDDAQTISSGIENVFFKLDFQDEVYSPAWQQANLDASGRVRNRKWIGDIKSDFVKQPIDTETLSDPVTFNYTASDNIRIADFQLKLEDAATDLTISITTTSDEKVWKYNFGVASPGLNKFNIINKTSPVDVRIGDEYKITISGGRVKGSASNIPWFTETYRAWKDVDLARMEDLGGDHTKIKTFIMRDQPTKVAAGTLLTGNRTFDFSLEMHEGVVGNGTLRQNGGILKADISPAGYFFNQSLSPITLNSGESSTWTLEFTLTTGGIISKSFTVSAVDAEELMYWDVQTSHDANAFNYVSITSRHAEINTAIKINIQTYTGSKYFAIAQPTSEADITKLVIGGINQIGAFTKNTSAITINTISYDVWISNNLLLGSVVSGETVEVIR